MESLLAVGYKGNRVQIDLKRITAECEEVEKNFEARMAWVTEKRALHNADKYMADHERALASCYTKVVIPKLASL